MFRFKLIAWALISLNLLGQEIPDYKAEYTYTNSKFSMDGIRELTTKEDGIRILKFEGKLPMGRIKISSNFVEEDHQITSKEYLADVKWTVFKDKRTITFDQKNNKLISKGKFKWTQALLEDQNIFDPLNVQIQIRKNIIANISEFSLKLPDLKTGAIEDNTYRIIEDKTVEVNGEPYICKVVERIRLHENRITRYFIAPELHYLIIKVEDRDEDRDTLLKLKKLL